MRSANEFLNLTKGIEVDDAPASPRQRMVHLSEAMREPTDLIRKVAPSSASVLLVGESGTGKELSARMLHDLSERRDGPFIAVDCGAIPETLIEGELFGHEKGAYTGAVGRQAGRFELAAGGTLFLDELISMPVSSQTKLLRALEERAFRRLGGRTELTLDTRLIAAVNEDPRRAIEEGRLREDLYYRINVITVALPPLRDRLEDIPVLAARFIQEFNAASGKTVKGIDARAAHALKHHSWPGNVRELRNVIERAVVLAENDRITLEDLPASVLAGATRARPTPLPTPIHSRAPNVAFRNRSDSPARPASWVGMTVDQATRRLMLDTLDAAGYNKTRAANMLGVSTKTVYNKLKEWSRSGDVEAALAESKCATRRSTDRGGRELVGLDGQRATHPAVHEQPASQTG